MKLKPALLSTLLIFPALGSANFCVHKMAWGGKDAGCGPCSFRSREEAAAFIQASDYDNKTWFMGHIDDCGGSAGGQKPAGTMDQAAFDLGNALRNAMLRGLMGPSDEEKEQRRQQEILARLQAEQQDAQARIEREREKEKADNEKLQALLAKIKPIAAGEDPRDRAHADSTEPGKGHGYSNWWNGCINFERTQLKGSPAGVRYSAYNSGARPAYVKLEILSQKHVQAQLQDGWIEVLPYQSVPLGQARAVNFAKDWDIQISSQEK